MNAAGISSTIELPVKANLVKFLFVKRNAGRLLLLMGASIALTTSSLLGKEPVLVEYPYPKDKASFVVNLPDGYKAAFKSDGSLIAVGPKAIVAIISMQKVKDQRTAKEKLPEVTKTFFLSSLRFHALNVQAMEDGSPLPNESGEVPVTILRASGKNSDDVDIVVTATAFSWEHDYFVIFTAAKPVDRDQIEAERQQILGRFQPIEDD